MAKRKRDGLFKRDGVFAFRFKDATDAWREKSTSEHDRDKAKAFKDKFLRDLEDGTLPDEKAEWTLEKARQWWLEFRKPRVAGDTYTAEGYRLKPMIRILGNVRLKKITNTDIDNYVTRRLGEEIAPWSVNKEVLCWAMILRKAKLWKRLAEDYKPLPTEVSDVGRAITRDEFRRLVAVAESEVDWMAALYAAVLAACTGLRGGEVKRLKIGQIDLEKRCLIIKRAGTKSNAGAREIKLNLDAMDAVRILLVRAGDLGANKPEHYLLPKNLSRIAHGLNKGARGYDPLKHQIYWDSAWGSLTEKAGLSGLRFHDLRHSFITWMVERGTPIEVIQTQVGNMSARMTRHYMHISSGLTRKAVELFDTDRVLVPVTQEKVYRA